MRRKESQGVPVLVPSRLLTNGFPFDLQTNLEIFNEQVAAGQTLNQAARATWTARALAVFGFTRVRVLKAVFKNGRYTYVRAHFYRPAR